MEIAKATGALALALAGLLVTAACSRGTSSRADVANYNIDTFALSPKHDEDRWPGDIAKGPDGALWFTELNGGSIGRIATAPQGKVTEYRIAPRATEARPGSIALGSDGALWFTVPNFHEIGRITTTGRISEFAVGENLRPAGIAAGSDGALWFTAPAAHEIGRITTAGRLSLYRLPASQGSPQNIVRGSDGALWFTERQGNVGRITSAGEISEIPVHGRNARALFGIAAGPDGAIWFTEPNDKTIGRIATTGRISEYRVPRGYPTAITASPDGALWFTAISPSSVNRIATTGDIRQFPLALGFDKPGGIAAGPDGALWFTIYSADKIARIVPTAAANRVSWQPLP